MKRSRFINLVLVGTSVIALTSCDQKPDSAGNLSFKDEAECQKVKSSEECRKAFEESKKVHAQTAPKFNSKEECEKLHGIGKCTENNQQSGHGGGSVFMPMMMGFMMGQMLGSRAQPIMPSAGQQHVQRSGFGASSNRFSASSGS